MWPVKWGAVLAIVLVVFVSALWLVKWALILAIPVGLFAYIAFIAFGISRLRNRRKYDYLLTENPELWQRIKEAQLKVETMEGRQRGEAMKVLGEYGKNLGGKVLSAGGSALQNRTGVLGVLAKLFLKR